MWRSRRALQTPLEALYLVCFLYNISVNGATQVRLRFYVVLSVSFTWFAMATAVVKAHTLERPVQMGQIGTLVKVYTISNNIFVLFFSIRNVKVQHKLHSQEDDNVGIRQIRDSLRLIRDTLKQSIVACNKHILPHRSIYISHKHKPHTIHDLYFYREMHVAW